MKPPLYSLLLLLISKDIKDFKVYIINTYRYKRSIEDNKIEYFIILTIKLNYVITLY